MTENEDGSKFTARLNATRGKSDSENWFSHEASAAEDTKPHPRIRPEAFAIVARNRRLAGSMGRMAGFSDDSNEVHTSSIGRRLRSAEAKAIAQRMTRSTDNWSDFEGNLANGSVIPSHKFGASIEAKEIMEAQTRKCDWFTHDGKSEDIRPRPSRPSTAIARASSWDWFSHDSANPSKGNFRRSFRRVRGDGMEYALRNHGHKNLLTTTLPEHAVLPLYRCPTKESQNYCRHNKESSSVAECMKSLTLSEISKPEDRAEKFRRADFFNWDRKGNAATNGHTGHELETILKLIDGKQSPKNCVKSSPLEEAFVEAWSKLMIIENAGVIQLHPKEVPKTQIARCITQMDKDAPPTPRRHRRHVSEEAESTYHKNRNGQMVDLIGNEAESTTYNYPPKIQKKSVNSEEAISNQAKARGTAVRTLLTHTDLRETPPRRQFNPPIDQVKIALGAESAQSLAPPPRRLMSAEARSYADRQRGTMRDLLTYG